VVFPEPFGPWRDLEVRALEHGKPRAVGERHAGRARHRGAPARCDDVLRRVRGQIVRTMFGEPGETLVERGVEQEAAVLEKDDAVGDGERPLGALLGEHDRRAERLDLGEQARGRLGVELGRRLVEQDELRPHGQGGREADPLQLPAGELVRAPPGQVLRADCPERAVHPWPDLRGRGAEVLEPERDVVAHERHEDLILRILEDRRDGAREVGRARMSRVQPPDLDAAGEAPAVKVRHEAGQRPQERRLPGPGRAEQRHDLARLDRQGHVRKGRCPDLRIRELEVFDPR